MDKINRDKLMLKEVLLKLKDIETSPKYLEKIDFLIDIINKTKGTLNYRFDPSQGDWISIEGYEYRYFHLREVVSE